jgi:hypothetical protein
MRLSPTKPRRAKFISVFLISAVSHALRYIDQTIRLKVEFELNGSKGYILNYVVIIRGILISITEARWNEAESAIAQNRIQIYSAAEVRFLDQWDLDLSFLTTSMGLIILSSEIIRQTKTWTNRSRNVTTSSGYVWHRNNRPWLHPLEWYVGITESWYTVTEEYFVILVITIWRPQKKWLIISRGFYRHRHDKKSGAKRLCTRVNS